MSKSQSEDPQTMQNDFQALRERPPQQATKPEDPQNNPPQPSTRDTKRKAHNERKIKAWIRSTTPEFDMVSTFADGEETHPEPASRPAMKRANTTPLLYGDSEPARATGQQVARQGSVAQHHPQDRNNPVPGSDTVQPSSWKSQRNPDPGVPNRPGALMEGPGTQLARPRTFSRGFSAGDIHSVQLGAINNPSSSSLASSQGPTPRKSRPSFSSAFTLPRSFTGSPAPSQTQESVLNSDTGDEHSEGTLSRRQPRKQPSLIKGLRGSLFGLLHRGEGEEGKMRRKESKADLRAQVLVDNATGREGSIDTHRKKSFAYGEGRQEDVSPPLPSPRPYIDVQPPSPSPRPHLRRSSNSLPQEMPQARLFSPITLKKAYGPSSYRMDKDMQASDSIESLSSPLQRANSTLEKGTSPRRIAENGSNVGTGTRKFRNGSDTAAWERKGAEPMSNKPRRGIVDEEPKEPPIVIPTVPPIIPARNLADVFTAPQAAGVLPVASPERHKGHRPRSQSWSASNRLDFTKFERPPIQGLRLQKKRSEPILNSSLDPSGNINPLIPLRTIHGSLGPALNIRPTGRPDREWHSGTLAPIHGIIAHDSDTDLYSPESTSSRLPNPYSPPNHLEDVYDSPTRTVLEDQDAAMRALEDALNGPRSGGAGDDWPMVDFQGGTHTARPGNTPRPISPRQIEERPLRLYKSPERVLKREEEEEEERKMESNKTPPREPLPRLPHPLSLKLAGLRNQDQRASDPFIYSDEHGKGGVKFHEEKEREMDALPRLSYSFARSRSRSRSSVKPNNIQDNGKKKSRRTLRVEAGEGFEGQPRLINIVYPRSAPATESVFRVGSSGKRIRQRTGSLGEVRGREDECVDVYINGEVGRMEGMEEMLKREREGKKRLEYELMGLQGRWLGAVGRIARLEQENEQLRRRLSTEQGQGQISSLPSFGSSTSGSTVLMTPERSILTPTKTTTTTTGKKEMHARYGSMDTIDRLEVDLGSPFAR